MYKQLILFIIGAVISISGCVTGYFAGQFLGGIICVAGGCMMLMGTISIGMKHYKESREKGKGTGKT